MKHVVLVVPEFGEDGGGLSLSASKMLYMLKSDFGFEVELVNSSTWRTDDSVVCGGYDASLTRALALELALKRTEQQMVHNAEVVIAFGGGFNAYVAMLLAENMMVDLIVCCRGTDANLIRWMQCSGPDYSRAYRVARNVVCLSNEHIKKVMLATGIERKRMIIIPNVMEKTSSHCNVPQDNGVILGCGATRLNEKKGVGLLLEMLAELKSRLESVRLELVGSVDEDLLVNYQEKACRLGVEGNVSFVGRLSRAEFNKRMKSWSLYVQGSICEGFPNSVADAIGMGKGVILTPTGYIAEYLHDYLPEAVFESYDSRQMASQICQLLNTDELGAKYENAYSRLLNATSRTRVADLWRSVFEMKTNKGRPDFQNDEVVLAVLFHDIREDVHDGITVSPEEFDHFVDYIASQGYRCCSMRDGIEQPKSDREKRLVMTFDDGYDGVLQYALPSLKKHGFTASVYVCTSTLGHWNDWNFKDKVRRRHLSLCELRQLSLAGWEIGSHGVTHRSALRLDEDDLLNELDVSKKVLENAFGRITSYAYPYGDYNAFIRSQVAARYEYGMALDQGGSFLSTDRYSIRRYMPAEVLRILTRK